MRGFASYLLTAVLIALTASFSASQNSSSRSKLVAEMERKLQHLKSNGRFAHPDQAPTEFSEQEVNAYFAAGRIALPAGVQSVHFVGEPGVISSTARIDFEKLKAGQGSENPLLSVFTGVHDVEIVAHARGEAGARHRSRGHRFH